MRLQVPRGIWEAFWPAIPCQIFVGTEESQKAEIADLEGKLGQLAAMGFQNRFLNERKLRKCGGDMNKTVWKLAKKVNKAKKEKRNKH